MAQSDFEAVARREVEHVLKEQVETVALQLSPHTTLAAAKATVPSGSEGGETRVNGDMFQSDERGISESDNVGGETGKLVGEERKDLEKGTSPLLRRKKIASVSESPRKSARLEENYDERPVRGLKLQVSPRTNVPKPPNGEKKSARRKSQSSENISPKKSEGAQGEWDAGYLPSRESSPTPPVRPPKRKSQSPVRSSFETPPWRPSGHIFADGVGAVAGSIRTSLAEISPTRTSHAKFNSKQWYEKVADEKVHLRAQLALQKEMEEREMRRQMEEEEERLRQMQRERRKRAEHMTDAYRRLLGRKGTAVSEDELEGDFLGDAETKQQLKDFISTQQRLRKQKEEMSKRKREARKIEQRKIEEMAAEQRLVRERLEEEEARRHEAKLNRIKQAQEQRQQRMLEQERREKELRREVRQRVKKYGKPLFKVLEEQFERNVVLPEMEESKQVLQEHRERARPIDFAGKKTEWELEHQQRLQQIKKSPPRPLAMPMPKVHHGRAMAIALHEEQERKQARKKKMQEVNDKIKRQKDYAESAVRREHKRFEKKQALKMKEEGQLLELEQHLPPQPKASSAAADEKKEPNEKKRPMAGSVAVARRSERSARRPSASDTSDTDVKPRPTVRKPAPASENKPAASKPDSSNKSPKKASVKKSNSEQHGAKPVSPQGVGKNGQGGQTLSPVPSVVEEVGVLPVEEVGVLPVEEVGVLPVENSLDETNAIEDFVVEDAEQKDSALPVLPPTGNTGRNSEAEVRYDDDDFEQLDQTQEEFDEFQSMQNKGRVADDTVVAEALEEEDEEIETFQQAPTTPPKAMSPQVADRSPSPPPSGLRSPSPKIPTGSESSSSPIPPAKAEPLRTETPPPPPPSLPSPPPPERSPSPEIFNLPDDVEIEEEAIMDMEPEELEECFLPPKKEEEEF